MSHIKIKNCGLSSTQNIDTAIETGAHFLGFVHYAPSPRHLPLTNIATLSEHTARRAENVVVTVNPNDTLINQINALPNIDYLQVHGVLSMPRLKEIKQLSKKALIIAIGVANSDHIDIAQKIANYADYLLLDYKTDQHGGSGKSFDWALLENVTFTAPWFLAGGLTANNVQKALQATNATMIDVSSGIETAPGKKCAEKIAAFNAAVLNTRT